MKKVMAILAALAAVGGALWVIARKLKERKLLMSEEFDDEDTIVIEDENEDKAE